jgi:sulfopyruvate decarboxylase TPP-binding subunit
MFFSGPEIVSTLADLGVTHVVWLPDSALGPWEQALESSPELRLLRVCREGEAWPLAAGLYLGGAWPIIMMQTTGLFESGDALRNVLYDLQLPLFAILGARSWLVEGTKDSVRRFTQPILDAWGLDYILVASAGDKPSLAQHYRRCREAKKAGAAMLAEGRM